MEIRVKLGVKGKLRLWLGLIEIKFMLGVKGN